MEERVGGSHTEWMGITDTSVSRGGSTDGQALFLVVESGSNLPPAGVCGDVVPERLKLCVRADEISR